MYIERRAAGDDLPELTALMTAAIDQLQREFLTPQQIAASHAIMGVDSQLIEDRTYFVIETEGRIAGCGGWSRRATLYGGDHSAGRNAALLDPRTEPARVRAMYTHPDFARRGIARRILERCEVEAALEGFQCVELMATMSGQPLYRSAGFEPVEEVLDTSTAVSIPLVRMSKPIGLNRSHPVER